MDLFGRTDVVKIANLRELQTKRVTIDVNQNKYNIGKINLEED